MLFALHNVLALYKDVVSHEVKIFLRCKLITLPKNKYRLKRRVIIIPKIFVMKVSQTSVSSLKNSLK